MSDLLLIPSVSIKPNKLVLYNYIESPVSRKYHIFENNKSTKVGMSLNSAKRIKNAVDWLYFCSSKKYVHNKITSKRFYFRLNFITLTLSSTQKHTDKEILKYMFEPFIRVLRNSFKGFLYVWKAEVQDNGNLHFHMNSNQFMDKQFIREQWNIQQAKMDYITESQIQTRNSTDVTAVKNAGELANYLSKYMAKGDLYKRPLKEFLEKNKEKLLQEKVLCFIGCGHHLQLKRKINIKLWDCSKILKGIRVGSIGITPSVYREIELLITKDNYYSGDYFEIVQNVNYSSGKTPELENKIIMAAEKVRHHDSKSSKQIVIDMYNPELYHDKKNNKKKKIKVQDIKKNSEQLILYG